jgi:hypothetical protein
MLKKRVMGIVLAAMLAVGGNAFACWNCFTERDVVVNGSYTAAPFANDVTTDYDINDKVTAGGSLQMETTVTTFATGDDFAFQAGSAEGYADVDAYANNWDTGLSSGAYAEASFNGRTEGAGVAAGGFGGAAVVDVESSFTGYVEQAQLTQEINYQDNQGISAYNNSTAFFSGTRSDVDADCARCGIAGAAEYDSIYTRGTEVTGQSFVTIDPYGSNRSYSGMTTSDAQIGSTNARSWNTDSLVTGQGEIGAMVGSGNVGAAVGAASYSFTGDNAGVGMAQISGSTQDYGSYSTAQSAGSSFAIAD